MKRRQSPIASGYVCPATPSKVVYMKAVHAWRIGARQIAKTGIPLYVYRCPTCDCWHLTKQDYPGSTKIDTATAVALKTGT